MKFETKSRMEPNYKWRESYHRSILFRQAKAKIWQERDIKHSLNIKQKSLCLATLRATKLVSLKV